VAVVNVHEAKTHLSRLVGTRWGQRDDHDPFMPGRWLPFGWCLGALWIFIDCSWI